MLFNVYRNYKKANEIWSNIVTKYTTKDVGKQKLIIKEFYQWKMVDKNISKLKLMNIIDY